MSTTREDLQHPAVQRALARTLEAAEATMTLTTEENALAVRLMQEPAGVWWAMASYSYDGLGRYLAHQILTARGYDTGTHWSSEYTQDTVPEDVAGLCPACAALLDYDHQVQAWSCPTGHYTTTRL